jgi:hypothetical protein
MQAFASRLGKTQVEMPKLNQSFDLRGGREFEDALLMSSRRRPLER